MFKSIDDGPKLEINKDMKVLDIFSGCGGLSEGFRLAGFNVNWSIDIDLSACCTNSLNHPGTCVINGDVVKILNQIKMTSEDSKFKPSDEVDPLRDFVSIPDNDRPPEPPRKRSDYGFINYDIDNQTATATSTASQRTCEVRVQLATGEWIAAKDVPEANRGVLMDYYMRNSGMRAVVPVEQIFVADRILDVRVHEGVRMYKVRWRGCGDKGTRWMPEGRIANKGLIQRFYREARFRLPQRDEVDIVIGGPPCQGMSTANRKRLKKNPLKDSRNRMLLTYINYIDYFRPKAALFENVCGIFSIKNASLLRLLMGRLVAMGYQVRCGVLQAAFYGVPQSRWRVFVLATRLDVALPDFPEPTHYCVSFLPAIKKEYFRMIYIHTRNGRDYKDGNTVYDALFDLPEEAFPAPAKHKATRYWTYDEGRFSEFTRYVREGSGLVTQHSYPSSWKALTLSDEYFTQLDPEKHRPQKGNDLDNMAAMKDQLDGYLPLRWNLPFPTIKKSLTGYVHPSQKRVLTIREYARAQCKSFEK